MIFILAPFATFAVLVILGVAYQRIGAHRDQKRFTGMGRWVTIGEGCRLFVREQGAGGPSVIFESGIAATNLNWYHIQEHVAQFAHTASYDRSGLGWSSPSTSVRTPGNIAGELHTMLRNAGIEPPYVLVGHSFGGLVVRRFALTYPEEVCGIVLVDPMRCEEWPPLDPSKQSQIDRGVKLTGYAVPIAQVGLARLAVTSLLCRSGLICSKLAGAAGEGGKHVLGRVREEVGKMPPEVWPMVAAHWSRPSYYTGMSSHVGAVPHTVREMMDAEPILGIPVTVLTPAKSSPLCEARLSQIGDNVRQIIAPASAHWIHLDEPDLVIESIRGMVMNSAPEAMPVSV